MLRHVDMWMSGCIDPHFISEQFKFMSLILHPGGKSPPSIPIGWEAWWAPGPVWTMWEQFLPLPGLEF
jgi:hypothetical protein